MVISLITSISKLKTNKQTNKKRLIANQSLVPNYSRTKRKQRITGCGVAFEGNSMHWRQRTTEQCSRDWLHVTLYASILSRDAM